jgi:hypothetical protein
MRRAVQDAGVSCLESRRDESASARAHRHHSQHAAAARAAHCIACNGHVCVVASTAAIATTLCRVAKSHATPARHRRCMQVIESDRPTFIRVYTLYNQDHDIRASEIRRHACAVSTTIEVTSRRPAAMRRWCTAPAASSGGIATRCGCSSSARSDSTRIPAPPRTASAAASQSAVSAASREPAAPASKNAGRTCGGDHR